MKKKSIIFAPHPDDETLGCGGSIIRMLHEGYDVYVVIITDGRYCLTDLGVSSGPTPNEIKEIRKQETLRAIKILGLSENNLIFLNFEEKHLERNEKQLCKKIVEILDDVCPSKVFFPQQKEYNIDHRISNRAIRTALSMSNTKPIECQYTIAWSFPYYLLFHVLNDSTLDLLAKIGHQNLVTSDVSDLLELKKKAIDEYKSQVTIIAEDQKRPVLKASFVKRFLNDEEKFFLSVD